MIQIKKLAELTGHSGAVYALEQSETQNCFYSGSSDKIIAKWNLETLSSEKFAAQLPAIVYSLCYVSEKKVLLAGTSEGKIHVIDLKDKKESKILQNHNQSVFDIQYSSQYKIILSAGGDGILSIISANDLSTFKVIKLCNEKLRAIDIYGNHAAIACGDGIIRIIDLKELKVKNEFSGHTGSVYSVTFSPDGKLLLSGGKDAHLNTWQMENGKWKMEKSIPAHNYAIYSLVFSPDGKYFATASRDKTIKIWKSNTYDILVRINKESFDGHINSVNKLMWKHPATPSPSQDNGHLISAGDDRKVMIWEVNP